MYYKKNIILFLTFMSYLYSTFSISIENSDFLNYKINVILEKVNKVSIKSVLEDKIIITYKNPNTKIEINVNFKSINNNMLIIEINSINEVKSNKKAQITP